MSKIPVMILSGFLGSGKTTLLLRLLKESINRELRPVVLMNELGTSDVDGQLVIDTLPNQEAIEKLLDGCICCNKKSEVVESMETLLEKEPDILFVELTGVANPEEVVDALLEPRLKDRVHLHSIITILDSWYYLEYTSIFETDRQLVHTLKRQVAVADIILANKSTKLTEMKKNKILKSIRKLNDTAPVMFTNYSEMDLDPLFKSVSQQTQPSTIKKNPFTLVKSKENHQHHHATSEMSFSRIQTLTVPVSIPLHKKEMERFLKKLHPRLLRAKGYVPVLNSPDTHLLQYASKHTDWEVTSESNEHYLVMIGLNLPTDEIQQQWNDFCLTMSANKK